jgi:multiple sugar transport system ATP-binding protein
MNFFDGKLTRVARGGAFADFSGDGIDIKDVRLVSGDKVKGDRARLGVRPQHLVLDADGPITGKITLVERLGTETIVELLTARKTVFRFASAETADLQPGEEVSFSFDPAKAHLF